MKSFLLTILLGSITPYLFSQTENQEFDRVGELKSILEQHLSGTELRNVRAYFELYKDSTKNEYVIKGNIQKLIAAERLNNLREEINRGQVLTSEDAYNISVFFDRYTDQAIVYPKLASTTYFRAMPMFPEPHGGMQQLSKRFHDLIRVRINSGLLDIEALRKLETVNFIIERDGSPIPADTGFARQVVLEFLKEERKWKAGLHSGRPIQKIYAIQVIPEYLSGEISWSESYESLIFENFVLSTTWENIVYYTQNKTSIPKDQVVVSAIYDSMLRRYRLTIKHNGSRESTDSLIAEVTNMTNARSRWISEERVYFYRPITSNDQNKD